MTDFFSYNPERVTEIESFLNNIQNVEKRQSSKTKNIVYILSDKRGLIIMRKEYNNVYIPKMVNQNLRNKLIKTIKND